MWNHDSATHTRCPYKGLASYKSAHAGETEVGDAAWCYPEPLREANDIAGWLCFYEENDAIELTFD